MRCPKILSNFILFLLTIALIVTPQASFSTITVYAHPTSSAVQTFSYESVLTLLEELENDALEEKCTVSDLDKINRLLATLAAHGILPGEIDEAFALENDIYQLLHGEQFNQEGIFLCKNVFRKTWDAISEALHKTKKFAKKHKKEILIGAAVVVGVAAVVVVVAAVGVGSAAAAGAAGVAGVLGTGESENKHVNVPEIPEIIASPMLQEALQEEVFTFKEWLVTEQFLNTDGFPLEESGKILQNAFVNQSLSNLTERFSQELTLEEPIDVYHKRGERAFELHYYDQSIADLGRAIELNPHNHEAYLDRAAAHLKMGSYERSLEDFAQYTAKKPEALEHVTDFTLGFAAGLPKGIKESGCQFGSFAKQCVLHPINTAEEISHACVELVKLGLSQEWATIGGAISPELHELATQWDALSPKEQGELAGYAFGKLGADILIPGTTAKVASASAKGAQRIATICKAFKNAEKTLAFEALTGSAVTSEAFAEAASGLRKAENVAHSSTLPFFRNAEGVLIEHIGPEFIEHFKNAEAFLKPYSKMFLLESQVRELIHQTGIRTFSRPVGIPEHFQVKISQKGGGMVYVHPETNISIRVMPGKPHSPNPLQQKPYVIQRIGEKAVDKFGNIVDKKALEAHIPINEFIYRST
ncbi:MAG: tetratricopeptide repeat protein [Chlamydiota bacterium]